MTRNQGEINMKTTRSETASSSSAAQRQDRLPGTESSTRTTPAVVDHQQYHASRGFCWIALLIIAIGTAVSGFTLAYGVHQARHDQENHFNGFASDVVRRLEQVWVRESCYMLLLIETHLSKLTLPFYEHRQPI